MTFRNGFQNVDLILMLKCSVAAVLMIECCGCGFHKSVNTGTRLGEGGTVLEKTEVQELEHLLGRGREEDLLELAERVTPETVNARHDYSEKYSSEVTLLMIAADWLQPNSIRFLKNLGADSALLDHNGQDAFFYAERSASKRLVVANGERWRECVDLLPEPVLNNIEQTLVSAVDADFGKVFTDSLRSHLDEGSHQELNTQLDELVELVPNMRVLPLAAGVDEFTSLRSRFTELADGCRAPLTLDDLAEYQESFLAIKGPAPVDELNSQLIAAVKVGDQEAISSLIDQGADLNHLSEFGGTPLMVALIEKQWAVVQSFIQIASSGGGLDLNVRKADGETALGLCLRLAEEADARSKRRYQRFAQFIQKFGGQE
ncbi:MAG: hypothetical protein HRT45_10045 [Bdellovibrionales bacterium]|nr:hypothetical protein [Bdellovibrionales bacterium]